MIAVVFHENMSYETEEVQKCLVSASYAEERMYETWWSEQIAKMLVETTPRDARRLYILYESNNSF